MQHQTIDRDSGFIDFLLSFERGLDSRRRAALAALRTGLRSDPEQSLQMYPYVGPFLSGSLRRDRPLFVVAALFASHPENWAGGEERYRDFGATLRRLASYAGGEREPGVERRFVALLNAGVESLPTHLRHLVAQCAAEGFPVDWSQLLHDVRGWEWRGRPVQRKWAGSFWRHLDREEDGATALDPAEAPNDYAD